MNVHLDTHVALWMVSGEKRRLRPVQARLRRAPLFVSPIVLVEMEILREIGRITASPDDVMQILAEDHGVARAEGSIGDVADYARGLAWTRDPFDRLIVAHALAHRATLLTADEAIRAHCRSARWD